MWKQVAIKELEERGQHADLDGLISGYGDPAKVGYMCRKCFYSYEKLLSTQATLELKVKKAIDAIASVPRWGSHCPGGRQKYFTPTICIVMGVNELSCTLIGPQQ